MTKQDIYKNNVNEKLVNENTTVNIFNHFFIHLHFYSAYFMRYTRLLGPTILQYQTRH